MDNKVGSLEAVMKKQHEEVSIELHKIENTISSHKLEVAKECTKGIEKNSMDIKLIMEESINFET